MKQPLRIACLSLLLAGFVTGCATGRHGQTSSPVWNLSEDDHLVLTTNHVPRSTYALQIYIVSAGDSVARIAQRFHTSIARIEAFNPDLNPKRLKIGMKLLVAEHAVE